LVVQLQSLRKRSLCIWKWNSFSKWTKWWTLKTYFSGYHYPCTNIKL